MHGHIYLCASADESSDMCAACIEYGNMYQLMFQAVGTLYIGLMSNDEITLMR